jgi:membrane associated rhomboid family serine protease
MAAAGLPQRLDAALDPALAIDRGASFGPLTLNGQWWRLLASGFVQWTPAHLLLNLLVLWLAGRLTERLYGSGAFLVICLGAAVAGGAASLFWDPGVISLGATGMVSGVLGAFLVFLLRRHGELPVALWRTQWLSLLLLAGVTAASPFYNTGIDNAADAGGLIAGMLIGWFLARPIEVDVRRTFPFRQVLAISMATPALIAALLWHEVPRELTPVEQLFEQHQWYTRGAADAERRWAALYAAKNRGELSDADLSQAFERQILPFWRSSAQRLRMESYGAPPQQRALAELLALLAKQRLAGAEAGIRAVGGHDPAALEEVKRLGLEIRLTQARVERAQLRITMAYRARGAAHSPPLLALGSWLSGESQGCVRLAPLAVPEAGDGGAAARAAAGCEAQRLFLEGDYVALDARLSAAAAHLADLPDGDSTLTGIDAGIEDLFNSRTLQLDEILTRTAAWHQRLPASGLPDLIEAHAFHAWAWQVRGAAPAQQMSPDAWLQFRGRIEMAAASLEEARARARPGPAWYALALAVGVDQSRNTQALRAVFDEGFRRFPRYLPLYREMLLALRPSTFEQVDALIRDVAQAHDPTDVALYARLYLAYAALVNDQVNIFTDALADWPLMKSGLAELRRRYPGSSFYLNAFAKSACVAGDMEEYAALRPQLDTHPVQGVWSVRFAVAICDAQLQRYLARPGAGAGALADASPPQSASAQ